MKTLEELAKEIVDDVSEEVYGAIQRTTALLTAWRGEYEEGLVISFKRTYAVLDNQRQLIESERDRFRDVLEVIAKHEIDVLGCSYDTRRMARDALNVHFGRNCKTCVNRNRDDAAFCGGCKNDSLASWYKEVSE